MNVVADHQSESLFQKTSESPFSGSGTGSAPHQLADLKAETLEETLARVDLKAADCAASITETASLTLDTASVATLEKSNEKFDLHRPGFSTKFIEFRLSKEENTILRSSTTIIRGYDSITSRNKKFIPIIEAVGGSDKATDGHRRDSAPIAESIGEENKNCASGIFWFHDDETEEGPQRNDILRRHLHATATGVVVRVNPGNLSATSQKNLDTMLMELGAAGIMIMTSFHVQKLMGAKDALFKIRDLSCGMKDTAVYYDGLSFCDGFRKSIMAGPRVIKQNRGSQGEGIWICELADKDSYGKNYFADMNTELILSEANDNHTEHHTVGEFLEFCLNGRSPVSGSWTSKGVGRYLEGGIDTGAMIVDQRFLPRIVEGEVRCLMIGSKLLKLVHKIPQAGHYSATLQSGAHYATYEPDDPKFSALVSKFHSDLEEIMKCFGLNDNEPLPLLWTSDFIFGEGDDDFYVGEFNCSCVGITQQLELCPLVAKTILAYCRL